MRIASFLIAVVLTKNLDAMMKSALGIERLALRHRALSPTTTRTRVQGNLLTLSVVRDSLPHSEALSSSRVLRLCKPMTSRSTSSASRSNLASNSEVPDSQARFERLYLRARRQAKLEICHDNSDTEARHV